MASEKKVTLSKPTKSGTLGQLLDVKSLLDIEGDESGENPLAWKVLSENEIQTLRLLTIPELELKLANILDLTDYDVSLVSGTVLDYYVAAFWHATDHNFNNCQLSCFLTLLQKILQNCKEGLSFDDNLNAFKTLCIGIGFESPAERRGLEVFNIEQAKPIVDYITESIFQHYKLYEFIFSHDQMEMTIAQKISIELLPLAPLPYPSPLEEGIPKEIYDKYIAPPPLNEASESNKDMNEEQNADQSAGLASDHIAGNGSPQAEKESPETLILKNLRPEEIKDIVVEMTRETLGNVKHEIETKIIEREASITSKLARIHHR